MPQRLREFVLGDSIEPPWQPMADVLAPRFQLAANGSRAVRRVWLDTFDWRLFRAGSTLEYITGAGLHEFALVTPQGERLTAASPKLGWPGPACSLPAGLIRDHVMALAGIRALLPVAAAASAQRGLRVLDSEDKTVVRLTVEDTASAPGAAGPLGPLGPRVTITPVRGYGACADRVDRLLGGMPGVTVAERSVLQLALAAAGRRPCDYTTDVGVPLTASRPAAEAMAGILLRLLDIVAANVDGVVRDLDTEFLHDLRIAVRRTRAALKLAGDALPDDLAVRFAPEFRWLGQLTTPTRDLDVHLLGFGQAAAGLVTATPDDLAPLHDSLLRYRAAEQRRLARGLRSARFASLSQDWRAALEGVAARPGRSKRAGAGQPIAVLAAARIRRAYRRMVTAGGAITAASTEEDLHDVRKRGKELRYLLEFFTALHDPVTHRGAVRELKQLQDCLGEIQDGHVQREVIRGLAVRMVEERAAPAATLLAMGELAAQLDAAADAARNDFGKRFARFTGQQNIHLIARLTGVAAA